MLTRMEMNQNRAAEGLFEMLLMNACYGLPWARPMYSQAMEIAGREQVSSHLGSLSDQTTVPSDEYGDWDCGQVWIGHCTHRYTRELDLMANQMRELGLFLDQVIYTHRHS